MKNKPSIWFLLWIWQTIKHDIILLYRALLHPEISINIKLAIIWLVLYIIAPIDIIPDRIFWLWIIDDAVVIYYVVKRIKKNIPQKIKDELDWKVIVINKK